MRAPATCDLVEQTFTVADDSLRHCFTVYVKKNTETTDHVGIKLAYSVGTPFNCLVAIGTDVGNIASDSGSDRAVVHDNGDWWRVEVGLDNDTSGNTTLIVSMYASVTSAFGAAAGNNVFFGGQLEKADFASSYIAKCLGAPGLVDS